MDHIIRTTLNASKIQTENGLDDALSQIERFFWTLPPHTIEEQRKLALVSERLGIGVEQITQMMLIKRAARKAESRASGVVRRDRRPAVVKPAMPSATALAPWEFDLLACMLQYDYAIDHAAKVEPYHFSDATRTLVFDSLKTGRSVEACIARIDGDPEAMALVDRLRHTKLSLTDESFQDQAAIIQIAETCAKRTRKEYLTRTKKREAQQARENGNMIRDEDMTSAVQTNREIRELAQPQQAVPSY